MAVDVRVGSFQIPSAGDTTISGLPQDPFAIIFWGGNVTSNDSVTAHAHAWMGYSDGTNHKGITVHSENGVADTGRGGHTAGAIFDQTEGTTTTRLLATASFGTNQFTVSYTNRVTNNWVNYMVFCGTGSAVVGEVTATALTVTGLTTTYDLVCMMTHGSTFTASSQHAFSSFGVCAYNGATYDQWSILSYFDDNANTVRGSAVDNGVICGQMDLDYTNWTATVTNIDANSVDWTTAGSPGTDEIAYMFIDLDGQDVNVGSFTKATGAAPASQDMPTQPFTPGSYMLTTAVETSEAINVQNDAQVFIGAYDDSTQVTHGATGVDGSNANYSRTMNDRVLFGANDINVSTLFEGTAQSITDTSPTISWDPNDATAYIIGYVTVEAGASTQDISPALTSQLVSSFAPTNIGRDIPPGLTQQLLATFTPADIARDIPPGLTQQLAAPFGPQLNLDLTPGLTSQLVADFAPQLGLGLVPGLTQQLVTDFAPTFTLDIPAGLVTQLAAAFDPEVGVEQFLTPALVQQLVTDLAPTLGMQITPALEQQLVADLAPSLGLDLTPALTTQLVAAFGPVLTLAIAVAFTQQLVTDYGPSVVSGIQPDLMQRLAAAFEPALIQDQFVTPALVSQLVADFAPQIGLGVTPGLAQRLAVAFDPTVIPDQDIAPALVTQLISDVAPRIDLTASPALVQQLVADLAPTVNLDLSPALEQQLAAAFDPAVTNLNLLPGLTQQLVASFGPQVTLSITVALAQQLVAAASPALGLTITPAQVSQLVAAFGPSIAIEWIVAEAQRVRDTGVEAKRQWSSTLITTGKRP